MSHSPEQESAAAPAFDAALDDLLHAWSRGEDPTRDELLRRHPDLGDAIAAVFSLASEIAVFRPRPAPRVAGFELLDEAGRGGMGVVYRARQQGVDRIVALKLLPEATAIDAPARARLLAEARGLGRIRHTHVVTIHGVIETSDVVAYAMEWIDGRSLASLLEELGNWPRRDRPPRVHFGGEGSAALPDPAVPWFCRLGAAIGRALGEVHRHGLVHRDVKPGNVLLRGDGTALLSDFGLVRAEALGLTRTGQLVGTPAFAAPEQLRAGDVGAAADVYGLGATLHCALAGQVPFAGRNAFELLDNIEGRRRRPLTKLGMPKDLETIVARCLETEPRDRYASADAVADDLENLLALRPVSARPLGWVSRCARAARRNRGQVLAGTLSALVVLAIAIGAGLWLWDRVTLSERVDRCVLAARFALLEPSHEERVEIARQGREPDRITQFAVSGDAALAAYDEALRLQQRYELRIEREVVAVAQHLLRQQTPEPSSTLTAAAPMTVRAARAWSAGEKLSLDDVEAGSRTDRRSLGLLGFLTGHTTECHQAWAGLELDGDPFIDAAAGQMHLQLGEIAPAYARLTLASHVWPDAGFLAVAMADCAVRVGDLAVAAGKLTLAESLGHKDTFDSELRVHADLLAAQGRDEEARQHYEWLIAHHRANTARLHYLPVLRRTGDRGRLVEVLLDLAERGIAAEGFDIAVEAWRWWRGLGFDARVRQIEAVLEPERERALLGRVRTAVGEPLADSDESSTAASQESSVEQRQARIGLRYLTEMTMHRTNKARDTDAVDEDQIGRPIHRSFPGESSARLASVLGFFSGLDPNRTRLHAAIATCVRGLCRCTPLLLAVASMVPSVAQTVRWSNPATAASGPSPRSNHMTAIDPTTGDVLLYGGTDQTTVYADFWRWNGTSWTLIANPAPPGPCSAGCMVNIGSTGEVLLFGGGASTGYQTSTWIWNGATWTNATPVNSPSPRAAFGMAYDSWRDRVVVYGGQGSTAVNQYLSDTWEWDPVSRTWMNVTPTVTGNPGGLQWLGMAFDRWAHRVVLHGGRSPASSTSYSPNTWTFDGTTWLLASITTPGRYGPAMAWDEARQRVVQFGGRTSPTTPTSSLLEWDGVASNWIAATVVGGSTPTARTFLPMVHHPTGNCLVAFGGIQSSTPLALAADTWTATPDCPPRVELTGPGCTPAATQIPDISRVGGTGPWLGTTLDLAVTNPPGFPSFTFWFADTFNPNAPLPGGCTLLTGLGISQFGTTQFSLPIPNNPAYCGAELYFQTASLNLLLPAFTPGFLTAMSNGLKVTIGTR